MLEFLKLAGGIAGIIALFWKIFETAGAYVQMQVAVRKEENSARIIFDTTVENKLHFGKAIEAAFLLFGPEAEDPEDTVRVLKKAYLDLGEFKNLNEMVARVAETLCKDEKFARIGIFDGRGRAIVPLTYYYWENINVGDERLTCSCSVQRSDFPQGAYAVRFYIEPKGKRLFRSVQTAFHIPKRDGFRKPAGLS